ncbi:MAG: hypothetical protein J6A28_03200 [Clostridia bacterium]|nr:hypothetical protein [Clostridia bacterium]
MVRNKTLIASIFSMCAYFVFFVMSLAWVVLTLETGEASTEGIFVIVGFIVDVLGIVFSAVSINAWNKTAEKYKKKKGVIITTGVLNLVMLLWIAIVYNVVSFSGNLMLYVLAIMLLLMSATILFFVDISQEKQRAAQKKEETAKTIQKADEKTVAIEKKLTPAETLTKKLARLETLKKNGTISEEEYSEKKKAYVKEYLG